MQRAAAKLHLALGRSRVVNPFVFQPLGLWAPISRVEKSDKTADFPLVRR